LNLEKNHLLKQSRIYAERSRKFLEQAHKYAKAQELEKLSEALWGAMTSALNALAILKETRLTSHNEIRKFARQLSAEAQDIQLNTAFKISETLHANYYHGFLTYEDILIDMPEIEKAVLKILKIIDELSTR